MGGLARLAARALDTAFSHHSSSSGGTSTMSKKHPGGCVSCPVSQLVLCHQRQRALGHAACPGAGVDRSWGPGVGSPRV